MIVDSNEWTNADGRYSWAPKPPKRSKFTRLVLSLAFVFLISLVGLILYDSPILTNPAMLLIWGMFIVNTANIGAGSSPFRYGRTPLLKRFNLSSIASAPGEVDAVIFAYYNVAARRITLFMFLSVFGWFSYASSEGYPLLEGWQEWIVLGASLCSIAFIMPTLLAEWAVPIPAQEEGDEEQK